MRRVRVIRTAALVVGVVIPSVILRELIEARFGVGEAPHAVVTRPGPRGHVVPDRTAE
jgi:hypothetical protein